MDRLLDLQAVDSEIDQREARRRELEAGGELAAARAAAEEAQGRLGEIRLAIDSLGLEQGRLEHEIDSYVRKAEAEEKRMYDGSIVNAKELEALQHEIANLKERKSRAEDELLEQMERREDLEAKAKAADEELTQAREALERTGGDASREAHEIAGRLEELARRRAEIALEIDEELLELYEDLRPQKKGVAAVALVDKVCQGCHQTLSAMELDRLRKIDGIPRCEYCRRILVLP